MTHPHPPLKLSVVMPAYNEEKTLEQVVRKVLTLDELHECIIVDDGSRDATRQIAAALAAEDDRVIVVEQPSNMGKTEALKTGFSRVTGDVAMIQDADLEYDPLEIPEVIDPIRRGHADVVYGSRFLVRKTSRILYFYHYLANKLLTFCSNLCTNLNMTDVETCYKAFRADIIKNMVITSSGFGFEIEVTAKVGKLARRGWRVYETPISYYGRTYEEGKKIGTIDGIHAFWYIIKFNLLTSLQDSFTSIPERHRT